MYNVIFLHLDDIASLLRTLVLFHYEEKCRSLQEQLHSLRGSIAACIPAVWNAAVLEKQTNLPMVRDLLMK